MNYFIEYVERWSEKIMYEEYVVGLKFMLLLVCLGWRRFFLLFIVMVFGGFVIVNGVFKCVF